MANEVIEILSGVIVEDEETISVAELCRCCGLPAERLITMVEGGLIEPRGNAVSYSHWQFSGECLLRVKTALRLQRDLNINLEGAILALELLDEIKQLRQTVACLKRQ